MSQPIRRYPDDRDVERAIALSNAHRAAQEASGWAYRTASAAGDGKMHYWLRPQDGNYCGLSYTDLDRRTNWASDVTCPACIIKLARP